MRRLFEQLDKAVMIAEELSQYDQRTQALGGDVPETPFIELLPSWNGYESRVQNQKRRLQEWLS